MTPQYFVYELSVISGSAFTCSEVQVVGLVAVETVAQFGFSWDGMGWNGRTAIVPVCLALSISALLNRYSYLFCTCLFLSAIFYVCKMINTKL